MAEKCPEHNVECSSPLHKQHLCYILSQGFHLSDEQEYNGLIENPEFKCRHCGHVAKMDKNLCKPAKL